MSGFGKSKKQKNGHIGINSVESTVLSTAAPPAVGAPAVPRGFVPAAAGPQKGQRPTRGQVVDAPGVAAEVSSSATFSTEFGGNAPHTALAQMLERAAAWRTELVATAAWHSYVRDQDAVAWRTVLGDLEAFKLAFAYASKKDATVVTRYPQLARLLGVRHDAGVRAARTRAAKKSAAAPAAKASPTVATAGQPTTTGAAPAVVTNGTSGTAPHA